MLYHLKEVSANFLVSKFVNFFAFMYKFRTREQPIIRCEMANRKLLICDIHHINNMIHKIQNSR